MRLVLSALFVLMLGSCTETFDPTGPGKRPYAVFGVLNAVLDTQLVRVYATNEPTMQPSKFTLVEGTTVELSGPEGISEFDTTTIHFSFADGRADSMTAFQMAGLRPMRGQTYELRVETAEGSAFATCIVPGIAELSSSDYFVLQDPYNNRDERSVNLRLTLSPTAVGYVVRLVLLYDYQKDGQWIAAESEVPQRVLERTIDYEFIRAQYPTFVRRSVYLSETYGFVNFSYQLLLRSLYKKYLRPNIRFKKAFFVVTQAEEHFFNFYGVANGFEDPNTIRVDKPDYSNVSGALGLFGAIANDTLAFDIPADLYPPSF